MMEHDPAFGDVDFCIVGSGPAAITVALRLAGTGQKITILTGGADHERPEDRDLHRGGVIEGTAHEPLEENRRRQYGGASAAWGGRCIPFDPIDLDFREWIPDSGWPISYSDIQPHLARANELCEVGDLIYDARKIHPDHPEILPGFDDAMLASWPIERWSPPTHFGRRYKSVLAQHKNVEVQLDCHATFVRMSADGNQVAGIDVRFHDGRQAKVVARHYVLACGALENARLLLASNDTLPAGIGNHSDCVGRYYMSHLFGTFTVVKLNQPEHLIYDFERDKENVYFRRRWWVTPECQRVSKIGNAIMFFFRPTHGFSLHRDSLFSAMFIAKHLLQIARQAPVTGWIGFLKRDKIILGEHLSTIGSDLPHLVPRLAKLLCARFFSRRRLPFVLPSKESNEFHLFFQCEHLPNRDSRVILDKQVDRHGMPRLKAGIVFSEADMRTALTANRLFAQRIRDGGFGEVRFDEPALRAQLQTWHETFNSSAHHAGTTRMSEDPAHGVVDRNCKVHGVSNLHIAGSSVFPTSSHANPTLMIVAMADRLGLHLSESSSIPHPNGKKNR